MHTFAERIRPTLDDWRERHPMMGAVGTLVVRTGKAAARIRVLGLAAEAAFFSLLSLPALLLGIIGTLGHVRGILGENTVLQIRAWVLDLAATALTTDTVESAVAPLVDDFLSGTQGGILSMTFLVSLWSGSRAMNVFIQTITIAYGLETLRGYVLQRLLAFLAYLGSLMFALVVLPLLVAGPNIIRAVLPFAADYLHLAYWPVVSAISLLCLIALYAVSVPVRMPLWRHAPGAAVAVVIWLLGSVALRVYLEASFGQVTIYGSLSAPIAVLAWLYVTALAVLVGSALNAEFDGMWPTASTATARARIAEERHAQAVRMVERRERALQSVAEEEEGEREESGGEGEEKDPEELPDRPEVTVRRKGDGDSRPVPMSQEAKTQPEGPDGVTDPGTDPPAGPGESRRLTGEEPAPAPPLGATRAPRRPPPQRRGG